MVAPTSLAPVDTPRPPAVALRLVPRGRAFPLGALLAGLGTLGLFMTAVLHVERLGLTICMLKAVSGIPCPTCGGTRALAHLARLDFAGALALNPLVVLGFAAVIPWALVDLLLLSRGRALDIEMNATGARWIGLTAAAALALNWFYLLAAGR